MAAMSNAERQQRFRARRRAAKEARDKLIIDARLGTLNAQQRALAAAALSAVSDILTGNQRSELQCRGSKPPDPVRSRLGECDGNAST